MTGLASAVVQAVEIAKAELAGMFVTHSPDGEYTSSYDVVAHKVPHSVKAETDK